MALTIFSSNRVETLQTRLTQLLANAPLPDPLAGEIIVVPTFAMARWLNLRIAQQQGVAANIHYPQMGEWIWQLSGGILEQLPTQDPYARRALGWQIFECLPDLLDEAEFAQLRGYLADDDSGIKRWQLALRIAESFDRYQNYRPELIRDWSEGSDRQWQAGLWRQILRQRAQPDRVSSLTAVIDRLERGQTLECLPSRISMFALSSLAPLYLEVLRALAPHTELNLYLHSPSDQYWADLENEKLRSRRRLQQPRQQELFDSGNELLASWGQQGQVFQDLLLNHISAASIDVELFNPPADSSLLSQIQGSIFRLEANPPALPSDGSLSIHICHSPMRECQVLLDQLLAMLDQDTALNPEDILVMIPDIAAYAPYIEAVFQRQQITCNISDITLADKHPLVVTFLQLLDLPRSRFTVTDILALLDNDALRRRFDIDAQALVEIRRLIDMAQTRWGLSGAHRGEFDLPTLVSNTWQQTRDRFFAGYALADDSLWNGIAALPAGDDAQAVDLGRFWHLLDRLDKWRERLAKSRSASDWQGLLNQLIDDFFQETDFRESRLQQIRSSLSEFRLAADCEISPGLMHYLMSRLLKSNEQSGHLYSGGITFCGMRPMRSIPFKVICLLGMNRADFPRRDPPSDFELLETRHEAGDPSLRTEDRYLMLETLLCARQKLYLSYCGRSLRDNSELQPSVLVQELIDFIDSRFDAGTGEPRLSQQLTELHPMQAFAAANFCTTPAGYSRYWSEVARQLHQAPQIKTYAWPRGGLKPITDTDGLQLELLRRFVASPIEYFFRHRLGIHLPEDRAPDDDESFKLDGLELWQLKNRLAQDRLAGRQADGGRLVAEGMLPHRQLAEFEIARLDESLAQWFDALSDYSEQAVMRKPIDIELGEHQRLHGSVSHYYPGKGLMNFHSGKFKGRQLLQLWIDHLALCASGGLRADEHSRLLANDKTWRLAPVPAKIAAAQLQDYVRLYYEGQTYPLPILPDSSYAWASETQRDKALSRVQRIWQNQWFGFGGDRNDAYIRLVLNAGTELPFDEASFDACAKRLYAELLTLGDRL